MSTTVTINGTIQPKHRRAVWTDTLSLSPCSEFTTFDRCDDRYCPKHETAVYAVHGSRHRWEPKHRGPITPDDQPVNAVCTEPGSVHCPGAFCPRHEPDNYTTHSARHAAGHATCSHCGAVLVSEDCPNYGNGAEHAAGI